MYVDDSKKNTFRSILGAPGEAYYGVWAWCGQLEFPKICSLRRNSSRCTRSGHRERRLRKCWIPLPPLLEIYEAHLRIPTSKKLELFYLIYPRVFQSYLTMETSFPDIYLHGVYRRLFGKRSHRKLLTVLRKYRGWIRCFRKVFLAPVCIGFRR